MNVLILDEGEKSQLETLNGTAPSYQKLEPALLNDGRSALNADLLTDIGEDGTWRHYAGLLAVLPIETVTLEQFAAQA